MTRQLLTLAAVGLLAAGLTGCGEGSPLNATTIGNLVGGQEGHLIKAGGHLTNAAAMSEAQEDALGQSVGVRLTNSPGLVNDPNLQKYVALVGFTVASASPDPGKSYVFGVLNSPEVNAYSGPNGYIFVTRGALSFMKDEAELAGVLAHELAHVAHHDGLHQVQTAEMQGAISEGLQANSQAAQFSVLADASVDVITKQGYSQPQENAADETGVQIMAAAGYNPASYQAFLQRLAQSQGASGGTLLSTHPGARDRAARVAVQISRMAPGGATLAERFAKHAAQ